MIVSLNLYIIAEICSLIKTDDYLRLPNAGLI